jgi:predicted metal-dependent hydrolase
MESIQIDGKPIRMSVKSSFRREKTVKMEFVSGDELLLTIPKNQNLDVEALVNKHRGLIQKKHREFMSKKHILRNNKVLYKGKPYEIEIHRTEKPNVKPLSIKGDSIIIEVKDKGNPLFVLKRLFREETEEFVKQVIDVYSDKLDEIPGRVSVTDTKRWGYCRREGSIIYNWQLIALPPELAELVVLHELVHLSHLNHQREFHQKMQNLLEDYRWRQKELKKYVALEPDFEYRNSLVRALG